MAWCHQATSHYLNQCWPKSPTPYGVTRPQWVNTALSSMGKDSNYIRWENKGPPVSRNDQKQVYFACLNTKSAYKGLIWLILYVFLVCFQVLGILSPSQAGSKHHRNKANTGRKTIVSPLGTESWEIFKTKITFHIVSWHQNIAGF